jgi:pantetheine-phosphate adenylyltransferase
VKRCALYAGSFNPWHEGHTDILEKSLKIFDNVMVSAAINPEKGKYLGYCFDLLSKQMYQEKIINPERVQLQHFRGLLVNFITELRDKFDTEVYALVRGLRNGHDLNYEMNWQYWNEDLGVKIPMVYFICDRNTSHISSSMIRAIEEVKKSK